MPLSLYLPNCDRKGFFKRKQVGVLTSTLLYHPLEVLASNLATNLTLKQASSTVICVLMSVNVAKRWQPCDPFKFTEFIFSILAEIQFNGDQRSGLVIGVSWPTLRFRNKLWEPLYKVLV